MAQRKKAVESTTTPSTNKQPTAAEMRDWYEKNKPEFERLQRFEEAQNGMMNLKDITKTQTKTVTAFSKETLRTYLKNIGSNEKNLRNLSRYLYYRCQPYYRLISYNANMFELGARSVVPQYDLNKEQSPDKILKDYYSTLDILDVINMQQEFFRPLMTCFREDVFYGITYYDETGFFILPWDADYAKIAGIASDGGLIMAIDMSWFRSRQTILEYWGDPFESLYREYESSGEKWQIPPIERQCVLKARFEDLDIILPPFAGLLNSIINLIDLEDISAIADAQEIYKLIFLEMETLTGAKGEDEWKVNPNVMIEYFNRMINECLPDYVSAALVPGELKSISMNDSSKVNDTNKIVKSTEAIFNSAGGSLLNGATVSGTTAFTAAIKADTEFAISALLPQIQSWLNRFLSFQLSNPSKVKLMHVSAYTKDELRKSLLESCQYGFSNILAYNTLNGFTEKDTIALNFLENDCLDLVSKFRPLQSSYTQTGTSDTGGAPIKDDGDLSDDGEASRDKKDQANG